METTATETTVTPIIAVVVAAFEVAVDVEDAEAVADEEAVEAISAEAITTVKMDTVVEVVAVDMGTTTPTAKRTVLAVATEEDSVDAAVAVVEVEVDEAAAAAISAVATTTEVKTDSVVEVVAVEDSAHAETMMRTMKMAPMTR